MSTVETLSRYGFIPERLSFAMRTALAACLALLLAWLFGLEHPQWSAMTVFSAAQSTRMMLLEKSFFRAVGTLIGTVLGVLLVFFSGGEPWILVLGLSAWIGACVFCGNVVRGFASYGVLLAGYSAAMVALLDTAHPDQVLALGGDRLLTVLTGVVTAALVGLMFSPRQAEHSVAARVRELAAAALSLLAAGRETMDADDVQQRRILRELAAVEDGLDQHGAGSIGARRSVRSLRAIVWSLVDLLIWLRHGDAVSIDPE
ncbi:MAG TPA: FUSC family protein, partial [Pseudorhizobium sp.]|nr:FUSC family protein [Pseudorhizobium sp.]